MSEKKWELFIVLENGKPAVLKNSKVWNCCVFHTIDEAVKYATYWCGKQLGDREIEQKEWFAGVDVSWTEFPTVVSIDTILIPESKGIGLHYPPGVRGSGRPDE